MDFANGLVGWQASMGVTAPAGQAVLAEPASGRSLLYQGVGLNEGVYELSFDFRDLLAAAEPIGFSLDTFFASLYLSVPGEVFDPLTGIGFNSAIGLLDLDANGARLLTGTLRSLGGGYSQYAYNFELTGPVVATVVFELANLNGINGDSNVLLDNVVLVPEPALSALLLAMAIVAVVLSRNRRKEL